jgi:hypothetical protein
MPSADRATVCQKKTGRPVRFELTEQTRQAVDRYIRTAGKKPGEFLFTVPSGPEHGMSTRQCARLVSGRIASIGLDPHLYGTHSHRRTKAALIYRRTGNLRAVRVPPECPYPTPPEPHCSGGEAQLPDILQNLTKSRFRREAHSSIRIQEGEPNKNRWLAAFLLQNR